MELVLSTSARYALRAAACLAASSPEAWVPSRDLVAATQVPPAYLSKVLRRLVAAGVLDSSRGHHGGFRLARPAAEIPLADVLRAMDEGDAPAVRCPFDPTCNGARPCPLHTSFLDLRQRLRAWSEERTLADADAWRCEERRRAATG